MEAQARVLPALAALHNFILDHDSTDLDDFKDVFDETPGWSVDHDFGALSDHRTTEREKTLAARKRDEIAEAMWQSYQEEVQRRGINDVELE